MDDAAHMRAALTLARRGTGNTWPNPEVGCVLVKDGRVVGRAVTAAGGRPHAETLALAMAGEAARGAIAYVTLEPCCHHGRTAPCTEALIAAGVARVVVGARDPDPRVDGGGIAALRAAGLEVQEGVLRAEAEEVTAGFRFRVQQGRPLVTLKLASTLDGRIATRTGESRWITGEPARRAAHRLRGRHDAVLVGVGTVLADDPELTCRLPGYRRVPLVRIVADSDLRTPLDAKVVATARETPTWFLIRRGADAGRQSVLAECGVTLIEVAPQQPERPDPCHLTIPSPAKAGVQPSVASAGRWTPAFAGEGKTRLGLAMNKALLSLGARGLTRVLVEGGARIAASLLGAGLVDRIAWFHAPAVMGGDGWPAAAPFGVGDLAAMPRLVPVLVTPLGADVLTELRREG
ncbi:MAG: bifunctional diaminohydroxyphosphoribosylaminopyrimidine deaminase/5-amino-6-(5-phosphoribosylamino)uracil reductase RibD [Alphaproteobacteria bacterium]|nr:bifunctional diaminohydroxyphosphoribosylaminopyrimidine deaminase/5-amino-6-(5-phosphoribosylamino)uracil reductase RibD [Alphaproteobacteria bacterium]